VVIFIVVNTMINYFKHLFLFQDFEEFPRVAKQ